MLSISEIKRFISDDEASEKKKLAAVGQHYYEGDHDIKKCRLFYYNADGKFVEDKTRTNIKISHPFFTELADQLSAYMLSFENNPIRPKKSDAELQDKLDDYFDDDFWSEIGDLIVGSYTKGFEYLYMYKDQSDRLAFQCADSLGVVEVREKDTDDRCAYYIYWYIDRVDKGRRVIRRIQVWGDNEVWYYVQSGKNGKIELDPDEEHNPRPHVVYDDETTGEKRGYSLGLIPFFRLDYNKKQISGLKPIKGLIDDYDLMECGLSNNLTDFDTPLHVVSGFRGENLDEMQQNLKTKKIIGVDADGDVQIRTVDIPYQARKAKADEDEKNIYRFGMGFNSSQVGDGNITNIVIKSRYALLDLKANKMQKRLNKLLRKLIEIVLDEINLLYDKDYKLSDVKIKFERSIIINESENIANEKVEAETEQLRVNTVLNLAAHIGDEQTLEAICDIMDWKFEDIKSKALMTNAEEEINRAGAKLSEVPEES